MTVNGNEPIPQPQAVEALFLVVIDLDGSSRVIIDPDARFTARRNATPKDIYPSLANVLADWQAIKTAEAVMSFQTQLASQLAAARQEGQ